MWEGSTEQCYRDLCQQMDGRVPLPQFNASSTTEQVALISKAMTDHDPPHSPPSWPESLRVACLANARRRICHVTRHPHIACGCCSHRSHCPTTAIVNNVRRSGYPR